MPPPMSWSPNGFGLKLPTFAGCSAARSPQSLHPAMPGWSLSPHQYLVSVPPRAAYSHSASLGSRYGLRVVSASHAAYCFASLQLTLATGASSFPVAVNPQAFAAAQAFHSCTETGNFPIANGLTVTWRTGFSETSSLLPIAKLPPRSVTISGSRIDAAAGVVG